MRGSRFVLMVLGALSLLPGIAASSRLSEFGPYLVPSSGNELTQQRASRAALSPGDPLVKIESGVLDRVTVVTQATNSRQRTIGLDPRILFSSPGLPVDEAKRVFVRIAGSQAAAHVPELEALGVLPANVAADYDFLEAWVPYDRVRAVAELPWVRVIGLAGLAIAETGSVTSEGDAIHRADQARTAFGIDGTGARVGVISDGVSNLAASQATNDLPPSVTVNNAGSGDEGTAMLEIVYDLAPGASLAFSSGNGGSAAMIVAQNWLANVANCNIISDDLWFPREPYFEDGNVATNAANLVTLRNVVYFTSAGNRAQRHVPQTFVDGGSRTIGTAGTFRPHAFAAGDYTLDVRLRNPSGTGVRHTIVLQWSEKFGLAGQNFDLYLLDGALANVIQSSTTVQAGAGDPVELIDFTYTGPDNAPAALVVDFLSVGAAPVGMQLKIAANGPTFLQYVNPAGSINPHAGHPLILALGAINQADPGNDDAEPFSSRGPTSIYFPSASTRGKPDAMGIDGVQVTGVGGFPTPFFGTSAASPHGAGIAALLRGAEPTLTTAEVRTALTGGAVDINAPGFDNTTGYGRLDAMNTLGPFFNQPPIADAGNDTTVECGGLVCVTEHHHDSDWHDGDGGDHGHDDGDDDDDHDGYDDDDDDEVICHTSPTAPIQLDGSRSSDPDGDPLTFTWTSSPTVVFDDNHAVKPKATFPMGTTQVYLEVSDGQATDNDTVLVTVADTKAPKVVVCVEPDRLWPPNHKLATIKAKVKTSDECDSLSTVRLLSITSSEPDNGLGDGDKPNDIQGAAYGTNDLTFQLRAERSGHGNGRVYTICYSATDASGNVGIGCAKVKVTHDKEDGHGDLVAGNPDDDMWQTGGYFEVDADAGIDPRELADVIPTLGGASFVRAPVAAPATSTDLEIVGGQTPAGVVVQPDPSAPPRVRWFVSAGQLQGLLTGSGDATIAMRFQVRGINYVVQADVPGVPPSALLPPAAEPDAAVVAPVDAPTVAPSPGTAEDAEAKIPSRLELRGGVLRPSAGGVAFGLPRSARVTMRLISPSGRVVARLVDGTYDAGWHSAALPSGLRAGVYLVVADAGGERARTKVLILR